MSDREVHWRPRDYWPANTEVWFDADLNGVDAGNGVIGNVHRTAHFRIGDSHVSIANAATHMLTVTENGAVVKTFPMSVGAGPYPTMSGKHLVLGKAAEGDHGLPDERDPARLARRLLRDVFWDTQISSTGEYVHAAPWSVGHQGSDNVSHGCINLSTANAEWFFNWSQRGDVVEVTGTPARRTTTSRWSTGRFPYDQWVQGSALYDPTPAPNAPRRS